ncbi:MAG: zinc ribbon domain-containing protein [Saccharofermentans sp.]|nr:zinc ribbon domain-containing protein [Saccharofermentans sp.]
MQNFCGKCGSSLEPGQKFCMSCGAVVPTSDPVPPPQAPKPVPSESQSVEIVSQPVASIPQPVASVPQPVSPAVVPVANNSLLREDNIPPAQKVAQPKVSNTQTVNAQQIQDDGQFDWNRVQPRTKPAGGRVLIIAISILITGLVLLIWALSVAVSV